MGDHTCIGPHVVIAGRTTIGRKNEIYSFSSLGEAPQDLTYAGEDTCLEIGDENIIREYCTINRGTVKGGEVTRIGNKNYFMAYAHAGHDCVIGDHNTFVNYSALSGHVCVENYVTLGAYSAIHQFCRLGAYCFVARATYVPKDILPFTMTSGYVAEACGVNTVGLKRNGYNSEQVENIRRAYKIIFRRGLTVQQAVVELYEMVAKCPEVKPLIEALENTKRGIVR
ncbi:MAG: acyl-ACP--UDP-N-acetylglucosamine O-acyltransferase [Legionellales bacterium]|nr:acyl-ACP--UDP-N-acetylglucosamine O-acyltransferase [Legionellales bacterium]